jgi:hypothetical protein
MSTRSFASTGTTSLADALLTINVGDDDAVERLLAFVGVPLSDATMPHLNRSDD